MKKSNPGLPSVKLKSENALSIRHYTNAPVPLHQQHFLIFRIYQTENWTPSHCNIRLPCVYYELRRYGPFASKVIINCASGNIQIVASKTSQVWHARLIKIQN